MSHPSGTKRIIVGITGASGAPYARRLIDRLRNADRIVHVVVSPHGERLLHDELGIDTPSTRSLLGRDDSGVIWHPYDDIGATIASGSFATEGMIICPCSGNTLAAVASGMADNLIGRAAAVVLKERRRLVVVPREMPAGRIELLNELRLVESGAIVCPASPAFYMVPRTMDDIIDSVVGKLLDLVGVAHDLNTHWADRCPPESRGSHTHSGE